MAARPAEATVQIMTAGDPDTESVFKELTKNLEAEFTGIENRFLRNGIRGRATRWTLAVLLAIGSIGAGLTQPLIGAALFLGAVITADRALR